MSQELRRKVHTAFKPAPLSVEQIQALYIDFDAVRGEQQPVARLAQRIQLAEPGEFTCQLLAGHRGSGKSTELARLRRELEADDGTFVITFTAEEELDLNDVDAPDLLLALARVICRQVKDRLGLDLTTKPLDNLWERAWTTLNTDLEIGSAKPKVGPLEVSVAIKGSPDYRRRVRSQLDPESSQLAEAVSDLIDQSMKDAKLSRFVLIVDDLDRVVTRALDTSGRLHTENLFVHRAPQLTSLRCHVIYTLPLDLAYSHHRQALTQRYGGAIPVVPMVRVAAHPPEAEPDAKALSGRSLLRSMVQHRLDAHGLTEGQVFEDGILDRLVAFSGGQPSELMVSVREAALVHGLPIGEQAAHRVEVEARLGYTGWLRAEHTPLLEEARQHGTATRTPENEASWRELVSSRALLLYINDGQWYAPNPALNGVDLPHRPSSSE